jgi:2-dehydro-3-deoxy-L-rhamnonate dehydrogenase (NAD+)
MANTYDVQGKSAIVTGGAKSIGRAVVQLLMEGGARVCVWDREAVDIAGASSQVVDIANGRSVESAVAALPPGIVPDILVNSAGYLGQSQDFLSHDEADWQKIIDVNLVGTMRVTQAIVPLMLRAGGGRVVNLGSLAGKEGLPTITAYSAASGGVISFTKALGRALTDRNVFVNCVAPGPIDTDMIRDLGPQAVNAMIGDSPMKRLGTAAEVAQLVVWLCTDASRFNAGAVFDMSGGRARY